VKGSYFEDDNGKMKFRFENGAVRAVNSDGFTLRAPHGAKSG